MNLQKEMMYKKWLIKSQFEVEKEQLAFVFVFLVEQKISWKVDTI